jgi:hypothetical protein
MKYQWYYVPGKELSLLEDHQTILTYHFALDRRKPYLHPVCTPSGLPLTCLEPWDHVWHKGLWFSWKELSGVEFWAEWEALGQEGVLKLCPDEEVNLYDQWATIATRFEYYPPSSDDSLMTETRRLLIRMPQAETGYSIDWDLTFEAHEKAVVLDRTPITQETPWGGYAGLSWRATRDMGGFQVMDSERRTTLAEMNRKQARWGALWGQLDGGWNRWGGMAMFDHPQNPRHPSHWYYIGDPGFGYLNPAFLQEEPFTIEPGNPLYLRYHVLIFEGEPTFEFLEEEYERYSP